MRFSLDSPSIKVLSGLFTNLATGWLGAVLIVPNFVPLKTWADFGVLTYDLISGILFLYWAIKLERMVQL